MGWLKRLFGSESSSDQTTTSNNQMAGDTAPNTAPNQPGPHLAMPSIHRLAEWNSVPMMPMIQRPMSLTINSAVGPSLASHATSTSLLRTAEPLAHNVEPSGGGVVSRLMMPITNGASSVSSPTHQAGADLVLRAVNPASLNSPLGSVRPSLPVQRQSATNAGSVAAAKEPLAVSVRDPEFGPSSIGPALAATSLPVEMPVEIPVEVPSPLVTVSPRNEFVYRTISPIDSERNTPVGRANEHGELPTAHRVGAEIHRIADPLAGPATATSATNTALRTESISSLPAAPVRRRKAVEVRSSSDPIDLASFTMPTVQRSAHPSQDPQPVERAAPAADQVASSLTESSSSALAASEPTTAPRTTRPMDSPMVHRTLSSEGASTIGDTVLSSVLRRPSEQVEATEGGPQGARSAPDSGRDRPVRRTVGLGAPLAALPATAVGATESAVELSPFQAMMNDLGSTSEPDLAIRRSVSSSDSVLRADDSVENEAGPPTTSQQSAGLLDTSESVQRTSALVGEQSATQTMPMLGNTFATLSGEVGDQSTVDSTGTTTSATAGESSPLARSTPAAIHRVLSDAPLVRTEPTRLAAFGGIAPTLKTLPIAAPGVQSANNSVSETHGASPVQRSTSVPRDLLAVPVAGRVGLSSVQPVMRLASSPDLDEPAMVFPITQALSPMRAYDLSSAVSAPFPTSAALSAPTAPQLTMPERTMPQLTMRRVPDLSQPPARNDAPSPHTTPTPPTASGSLVGEQYQAFEIQRQVDEVQRQFDGMQRQSAMADLSPASPPPAAPMAAVASGVPSGGVTGSPPSTPAADLDHLAASLYDRIARRLRRELLDDRERAGLTLDRVR
jgi:hypothetical protein